MISPTDIANQPKSLGKHQGKLLMRSFYIAQPTHTDGTGTVKLVGDKGAREEIKRDVGCLELLTLGYTVYDTNIHTLPIQYRIYTT